MHELQLTCAHAPANQIHDTTLLGLITQLYIVNAGTLIGVHVNYANQETAAQRIVLMSCLGSINPRNTVSNVRLMRSDVSVQCYGAFIHDTLLHLKTARKRENITDAEICFISN